MPLSAEQARVAGLVLTAGDGRLALAGGGALLVHGLVDRVTQDIDAFTSDDAESFRTTVIDALQRAGYLVDDVAGHPAIIQLSVRRPYRDGGRPTEAVQVEVLRDFIRLAPVPSPVGPTLDPRELASNKVLAIYDRPRARDFDDLYHLVPPFDLADLLALADEKTVTSLDRLELAAAFRRINLLPDSSFPHPELTATLRTMAHHVADSVLTGVPSLPPRPARPLRSPVPAATPSPTAPTSAGAAPSPFADAVWVTDYLRRNGTLVTGHWRRRRQRRGQ